VVCFIPCIKGSCMKKPTNAFMNYIRCLLTTPTCFGRLLRPSSVLKGTIKSLCGESVQDLTLYNVTKFQQLCNYGNYGKFTKYHVYRSRNLPLYWFGKFTVLRLDWDIRKGE
jgi:hypothetical protein